MRGSSDPWRENAGDYTVEKTGPTSRSSWCKDTSEDPPMPLSGEAIRLMNYVDDVSTTLRRILALAPTLTADERIRVSDHLTKSQPSVTQVLAALAK